MNRRRCLATMSVLVFLMCVSVAILIVWKRPNLSRYQEIKIGMSSAEVEGILGRHCDEKSFGCDRSLYWRLGGEGEIIVTRRYWESSRLQFYVEFDESGIAIGTGGSDRSSNEDQGMLSRVWEALGW